MYVKQPPNITVWAVFTLMEKKKEERFNEDCWSNTEYGCSSYSHHHIHVIIFLNSCCFLPIAQPQRSDIEFTLHCRVRIKALHELLVCVLGVRYGTLCMCIKETHFAVILLCKPWPKPR